MAECGDASSAARIARFWGTHQVNFGKWFVSLPGKGQRMVIAAASPDMPEQAPKEGVPCRATDILLPELNYESLLKNGGRGLNILFNRRASPGFDAEDTLILMKVRPCRCV